MDNKVILITGAAGFIGYHLVKKLIAEEVLVVGLDNLNDYYSVELKKARLIDLGITIDPTKPEDFKFESNNFIFYKADLLNKELLEKIIVNNNISIVCNLAAQAGVRYSFINPKTYVNSNIIGFHNLLEVSKGKVDKFIYASSSSVYGDNLDLPFKENQNTDSPLSIYAATKKINEVLAHSYSSMYKMETIGLRFFTVYGPWGRPDMSYFKFLDLHFENKEIEVHNNGQMLRDFTFIETIIKGLMLIIINSSKKDNSLYRIYNMGSDNPINLLDFINILGKVSKIKFNLNLCNIKPGESKSTHADITKLKEDYGFTNNSNLEEGLRKFYKWYINYKT